MQDRRSGEARAWRDEELPKWTTEGGVSHYTSLCNTYAGGTGYKHWMDLTNLRSSVKEDPSSLNCGCIGLLMIWQESRFRSGTPQWVLTIQVIRWQCSSTQTISVPRTSTSWKWGLFNSTRLFSETVVQVGVSVRNFGSWVTVRLYSPWKTTMTSGRDVSEYLVTLGLVTSYFFKFLRKKIKNRGEKKSWCSYVSRGSDDPLTTNCTTTSSFSPTSRHPTSPSPENRDKGSFWTKVSEIVWEYWITSPSHMGVYRLTISRVIVHCVSTKFWRPKTSGHIDCCLREWTKWFNTCENYTTVRSVHVESLMNYTTVRSVHVESLLVPRTIPGTKISTKLHVECVVNSLHN